MGYGPWGHKRVDMTKPLTVSLPAPNTDDSVCLASLCIGSMNLCFITFLLQKHLPLGSNQMPSPNLSVNVHSLRMKFVIRGQMPVSTLALPTS